MMSPMMQHYLGKKKENPECILLYRLGDFYECFFEDAELVSKALDIALTGKDCGDGQRAPMCGVPYHALDTYLSRLVEMGYKVAICEQLTEPQKGKMVERDIVRIVTPGTIIETDMLDSRKNNFLASIYCLKNLCSISYIDISTGEIYSVSLNGDNLISQINDELLRIKPSEIICNNMAKEMVENLAMVAIEQLPKPNSFYEWAYSYDSAFDTITKQYQLANLESFDIKNNKECICSCGALIEYCNQTQKRQLNHLKPIKLIHNDLYMHLDYNVRKDLELVASMKDGKRRGSLLGVLDTTKTAMGARFFKTAIEQPYQNEEKINNRLDAVDLLYKNLVVREAIIDCLENINDIERLSSKVVYGTILPRDCVSLKKSISNFPKIKQLLSKIKCKQLDDINNEIVDFTELEKLIDNTIKEEATGTVKEGGFIKDGFNKELDEYRKAKTQGAEWLINLEKVESEKTGIKNIKIKYNRVFGYLLEVSKSNLDKVPSRYIRKQTISNNERYVTEELKEIENKILNSEENSLRLENEIFEYIKSILTKNLKLLLDASSAIAELDFLVSLADVASKNGYTRPCITSKNTTLNIVGGRHPVVEQLLSNGQFIPNDIVLDDDKERIMILTGPNMAGKSTYMRQVAIIAVMAHIGSFVPCKSATLPIFDRIFTRVGASDNLAFGQSTFMVEMSEVATILNNATDRSLIILDEVGRGTSTHDGLSIAWSIMEYISKNLKSKTLFATHYHELTQLEGMLPGVMNYCISVKETNSGIVFLRKIIRGGASKSFGVEVAKLAGIPKSVTKRANEILSELEHKEKINIDDLCSNTSNSLTYANDYKFNKLKNEITSIDINNCTPFEAMQYLMNLKQKVGELENE